ncbi:MAG: hypothetical protein Ta2A_01200 [Treponemataceae bacterium]|nr:MAG: hypothetical protein Ta2A_01200 [Treponemataceae bacterium]
MRYPKNQLFALLSISLLFLLSTCRSPPPRQAPVTTNYADVRTISVKTDTGLERGPALIANKFEYDVIVPSTTKTVTINAILSRVNTTINYRPSQVIPMQIGKTAQATITTTTAGASSSNNYVLNITPVNLDIGGISLTSGSVDISPPVIKGGLTYNIEVPGYFDTATLVVTPEDPTATVKYSPTSPATLREGATTTMRATISDRTGRASQVYTFNLKRPIVKELYVKADGSDSNLGTSKKEPLQTLGKAFAVAARMKLGTIVVLGTLNEESEKVTETIRDSGSVFVARNTGAKDIVVRGEDTGRLSGAGTSKRVLKLEGNSRIRLENIALTGGYSSNGEGAGIYVDRGAAVNLSRGVSVNGNRTTGSGAGGIFVEPRGAVTLAGGTITKNSGDGIHTRNDGLVDMQTGIISVNTGRGIYLGPNSTFTLKDGLVTENISPQPGGGVYLAKSTRMTMTGGTISDNVSEGSGGGIYSDGGNVTMNAGVITNNSAAGEHSGGGIYVANGTFNMGGGRVFKNNAGYEGGGVYLADSTLTMRNGTISENTTNVAGAGVYLHSVRGTIDGGEISKNLSQGSGGGVYVDGASNITMSGSRIINNEAQLSSGGLFVYSGIFNMKGGTIDSNKAPQGAGIYVGDVLNLSGGTISNNQGRAGGGVFIKSREVNHIPRIKGNLVMTGGSISGNKSTQDGGGVFIETGVFEQSAGTIERNSASNGSGVYLKNGDYVMSSNARVANGNNVFLGRRQHLTVSGELSNRNTANLEIENGVHEDDLLLSDPHDGGNFVATNYTKFTVNGQSGMITPYGLYIP